MLTSLIARTKARLALLADSSLRVDADEYAAASCDALPEVDTQGVALPDPTERVASIADAVTPLERLERDALVSRDFRAAGKGRKWDRCREYDPKIYGWPKDKSRGQARGVRPWSKVTTIVLHTAGVAGMHPDRWLGVPCNAAVANDATVVLCHELTTYLWAAHAANSFSASIEIAGNRTITEAQVVAGQALLRYMVELLRSKRPGPVYVAPHRFYHKSRAKDCDVAIWETLGEWGMRELGLELGPVLGSGKPLPF